MKLIWLIFLLVLVFYGFSQNRIPSKTGIELDNVLQKAEDNEMIPLLLRTSEDITEAVMQHNGRIRMQRKEFYSVEIPARNVEAFLNSTSAVQQMEFSKAPGRWLSDSMRTNNNIDSLQHFPSRFLSTHTGEGVIMGIIDSGIDFSHPDFKDSTGKTRILYLWDQAAATNPSQAPQPYGYGVLWNSTDIDNGICTHIDPPSEFGHGTMVAGAAAGNGLATGNYKGAAPAANLIVVATDYSKNNWLQTVAEAVDFIFSKASQLNRPCVINISAGTYAGSHDGKDIAAQIIDQLVKAQSGRAIVAAAGNAGQQKFHLGYDVTQDTNFTWFSYEPGFFTNGGIFFEVFADSADFTQVKFAFGADKIQATYALRGQTAFQDIQANLNVLLTDTIKNNLGQKLATVKTYAEVNQGVYSMEVAIFPDSTQYRYRFSITGNGKFDIWSSKSLTGSSDILHKNLPTVSQYPAMAKYKYPDSLHSMVSSFTCLPSVITVANYINRNTYPSISGITNMGVTPGEISPNSSLGPTRTGLQKPDIAAPGDNVISAGKLSLIQQLVSTELSKVSTDSMHMRNGGTSMAAPGVAGILALYLEKCPTANYLQLKNALINAAAKDLFTPSGFSIKWGHGKANAYQFLKSSNFIPPIYSSTPPFCSDDTVSLQSSQNYASYSWSNGDSTAIAEVKNSGDYFLIAQNPSSCRAISDTLSILFSPAPAKPVLSVSNDTIYSSGTGKHNWYYNGSQISGEYSNFLKWVNYGNYKAEVFDTLTSCSSFSDTLNIQTTSLSEDGIFSFGIYPNPTKCAVNIQPKQAAVFKISLYSMEGKLLLQKNEYLPMQPYELNLCPIYKGSYFLLLENASKKFSQIIQIR